MRFFKIEIIPCIDGRHLWTTPLEALKLFILIQNRKIKINFQLKCWFYFFSSTLTSLLWWANSVIAMDAAKSYVIQILGLWVLFMIFLLNLKIYCSYRQVYWINIWINAFLKSLCQFTCHWNWIILNDVNINLELNFLFVLNLLQFQGINRSHNH